ncbi:hypothetical protein NPIL_29041 [Nephila pilipes]|uniref:Uncharacterized protein n=1 Tax=Nephila pilipes TaxID=299642 RepID=A0A8X6QP72_NEPPI|nr:hypothetical protein NPIL_29041 [Nephila pilipes]
MFPIIQAPTTLTTMATIYENLIDQDMYSSDCSSSRASTPSIVEQPLSTCYELKKSPKNSGNIKMQSTMTRYFSKTWNGN